MNWIDFKRNTYGKSPIYSAAYVNEFVNHPLDIIIFLRSCGISICKSKINELSLLQFKNKSPQIVFNESLNITDSRYNIAYQFGYLLLHSFENDGDGIYNNVVQDNDLFAINFLIPSKKLLSMLDCGHTTKQMLDTFKVSEDHLEFQIKQLLS